MENNSYFSLELLFLNDLFNSKTIYNTVYSLALEKITKLGKNEPMDEQTTILATA